MEKKEGKNLTTNSETQKNAEGPLDQENENLIPSEKVLQEGIKEYFLTKTDTKEKELKLSKQGKKFLILFGLRIIVIIIKQANKLIKERIKVA